MAITPDYVINSLCVERQKRIDKKYGVNSKIRENWETIISLMMKLSQ